MGEVSNLQTYWQQRNTKFREWYEYLVLIDKLSAKGMESYVSNEPATFFQMAHYLLTKGTISHYIPIIADSAIDLDNRAKVHRGCQYMWHQIDRNRKLGGNQSYISDMAFYLLTLGWYATVTAFDPITGMMKAQVWNPYETYPSYANDKMIECVHSYSITQTEAVTKASDNGWNYNPTSKGGMNSLVVLNDFFQLVNGVWQNIVLIDGRDVTGWVPRPEMNLLVAPVGGYPDRGALSPGSKDWRTLTGKGIFEVNETVATSFNKWKSMVSQILRDTAQPITQEFTANPQATPEQLRERGGLFHYAPGEVGLQRLPPAQLPPALSESLVEHRRELQKGSFNDAVFGMIEGQAGYTLSLLASSSANQILYPYMEAKHFVLAESDNFWLSNLKLSKKNFQVKGKYIELLKPADIPDNVSVVVESDVATPVDWLQRGTIGGMIREDVDKSTLLSEVYKFPDPQSIIRAKQLDDMLEHPMSKQLEMIASYVVHANYLDSVGDKDQADLFRQASEVLKSQMGQPAPGQANNPMQQGNALQARQAGAPQPVPTVSPSVVAPETVGGFTPQNMRKAIGQGTVSLR